MHLMQKCCVFCFAKNKDAALTFCLQNVRKRQNAFDAALTFCLQNVRKRQNAFWRKGKCSLQKCI